MSNPPNEKDFKDKIKDWWASNPMTYGTVHGGTDYPSAQETLLSSQLGTREFFELADRRFYEWSAPLHTPDAKFGRLFAYDRFREKRVLEIGCGMGCMAMNWASHGAHMTATDLNPVSITQTKRRFELFGLSGNIQEMDAQHLSFPEASFDYVYSWGVLHHSPNIEKAIAEIYRVMTPGATAGVMLYNRDSLLYRYTIQMIEGYLHMENAFLTPLELASRYGDGALEEGNVYTWPVTTKEVYTTLFPQFQDVHVQRIGTDLSYVFDLAFPRLGSWMMPKSLLKRLGRRWGWSLWITLRKA